MNDRSPSNRSAVAEAALLPHERSLAAYGAALRSGAFTAQAAVEACVDRIAAEAALDAFTYVDASGA